jgi:hypothetical protein
MVFDVSVAITWVLFLALFPIAFFWLRRAWRIIVRRDFSEVALKRGEPPSNPAKFAPYAALVNFIGGIVILFVIVGIVTGSLAYQTWSALAGSTIWMKFIFDFILSRHAHMFDAKKESASDADAKVSRGDTPPEEGRG